MAMLKYVFRDSPLTIKAADKADPQKIGEALAKIAEDAGGELTPKAVILAARNARNPLHKHFEWDDEKAAESWRIEQARTIIRLIHVEDTDASEGHASAFISISDKGGTSYRTLEEVKGSPDLQSRVLAMAERDLEAFEKRYRALEDICAIIKTAREQVRVRREKAETRTGA